MSDDNDSIAHALAGVRDPAGKGSLAEAGRIAHPAKVVGDDAYRPPIGRSLVVGQTLYTLSYTGLAANRVGDLAALSFTPFG